MGATDPKGQAVEATFYHPDDNLANTIVKAWREKSFKDTLLTYPDLHNKESWERRDQPDYERVSKALAECKSLKNSRWC